MEQKNEEYLNNLISSIQSKLNTPENNLENNIEYKQNIKNNETNLNNDTKINDIFDILINNTNSYKNENKKSSRTNLLIALKPYLKKSRQNKIDEYISYLNLIDIIKNLNNKGD